MAPNGTFTSIDATTKSVLSSVSREAAPEPFFPSWPIALLGMPIVLRATIFAAALVFEPWSSNPDRIVPAWAQISQSALYLLIASLLVTSGRRDRRAWSLGLFILDAGSTLLEPFVRGIQAPPSVIGLGLNLRTDAFQAALLWFFASEFPKRPMGRTLPRLYFAGIAGALSLGLLLLIADSLAIWFDGREGTIGVPALLEAVRRRSSWSGDWYFSLQFLWLLPLLVVQPLKLRQCSAAERRRFRWLVAGLAGGYAPLMIEVYLETFVPGYVEAAAPYLRWRGVALMVGWTLVPVSAAYAALFQRTLDLRLILRAAVRYVFAQWVVRLMVALPLVLLAGLIVRNRDQRLVELVTGTDSVALLALAALGAGAAFARSRLLAIVDRGFLRETVDSRAMLGEVLESVRRATTVDEVCVTTTRAITKALHPKFSFISIAAIDGVLHPQDSDQRPLSRSGALGQLIGSASGALVVDPQTVSTLARLPADEKTWILSSQAVMLVGLRGADGELHGLVSIGEKQSELDYTAEEKSLLEAVGNASGMALDRILAIERSGADESDASDPPARECVECGIVVAPHVGVCPCGGMVVRAHVPMSFGGRLVFQRRVGAGGMGVVYQARDVRLDQVRAVKTLPKTDPAMVARLRREAKTMAAVQHPNLAILHGLEIWKDRPLLVMEYLEGGSLADAIRNGPIVSGRVVEVCLAVADAVGALHAAGVLHRDIKPSNIGFSASKSPKLLDFGLAKFLIPAADAMHGEPDTASVSFSSVDGGIRGTPAYMSPEVLLGANLSSADDLWSLSVTMLESRTGTNPFRAPTVAETISRVLTNAQWITSGISNLTPSEQALFKDLLGPVQRRPSTVESWMQRTQAST